MPNKQQEVSRHQVVDPLDLRALLVEYNKHTLERTESMNPEKFKMEGYRSVLQLKMELTEPLVGFKMIAMHQEVSNQYLKDLKRPRRSLVDLVDLKE